MNELDIAWNNATSFTEKDKPEELKYIGSITRGHTNVNVRYLFYKDIHNQYWYKSERQEKLPV
jgi:hypothetical protein